MKADTIIIGAGISGLACAYYLKKEKHKNKVLIYEAQNTVGGLCASYQQKGFTFDYSGHLLHTASRKGKFFINKMLGDNKNILTRQAYILTKGKRVVFPFQNNLRALDKADISACVSGAIKAYSKSKKDISTFRNWALSLYGEGICREFMFPYNSKLWSFPLEKLSSAWCGSFVPSGTLEDIIKGAYSKNSKKFGYNSTFIYPKQGGCGALCNNIAQYIENINLNSRVKNIDILKKTIKVNGQTIQYDKLISTAPLPEIGKMIKDLPPKIKENFKTLKHNSLYVLNIAFKGKAPKGQWFYLPEDKYPFYRVGVQSSFSSKSAPKGTFSLYIEFSVKQNKKADTEALKQKALSSLKDLGFIAEDYEILAEKWIYIKYGYPIYDSAYAKAKAEILAYLVKQDIYLLGRYGAWEYSFMEKSILDASNLAKQLSKVKL